MSNKKRIQKRILEIELMRFGKVVASMNNLVLFYRKWKEKQKSLKLISGAVEPKGLITESGAEIILDRNIKYPIDYDEKIESDIINSFNSYWIAFKELGEAIKEKEVEIQKN